MTLTYPEIAKLDDQSFDELARLVRREEAERGDIIKCENAKRVGECFFKPAPFNRIARCIGLTPEGNCVCCHFHATRPDERILGPGSAVNVQIGVVDLTRWEHMNVSSFMGELEKYLSIVTQIKSKSQEALTNV